MYIKRLWKKILAVMLCAVLLCGALPMGALGDGEEADPIDAAQEETEDADLSEDASEEPDNGESSAQPDEEEDDFSSVDDTADPIDAEEDPASDEPVNDEPTDGTDTGEEDIDLASEPASAAEMEEAEEDAASDEPSAISEDEEEEVLADYVSTTTAILTADTETTMKLVLESYLTSTQDTEETIKPCDIIFLLDQSKWMNTEEDSGAQRAAIIKEIKLLLEDLAEPTTGEHRVAIAGYGRVNMGANTDTYNASVYPGVKETRTGGISLNTGYYNASGFVTQNGWSDVSQSAMTGTGLPTMPASYKNSMTYDNAFMTIDEANTVLDNSMLAWYAGASRMDAGLTIAEQLAAIAAEHDTNGDRNLIVCVLASSLPIQNTVAYNISTIRTAAVLAAAEQLKSTGATIFAFGSYHNSGKTISGDVQDTEDTFDSVMEQLCSKPEYYYSFSDFASVTDALNDMMTQIVVTAAGESEQSTTVQAQEFSITAKEGQTATWQSVLDYYGSSADSVIANTMARVEYYYFTGYDSQGEPTFDSEPYITLTVPLSEMVAGDGLSYEAELIPLPSWEEEQSLGNHTHYGSKVRITIAAPVTVTYQWVNAAPSNAVLPAVETVALGTVHAAATVHSSDGIYDAHYSFAGWYTDAACTNAYSDNTAVTGNITLYGKWKQYVLVEYYWNIWESSYDTPDDNDQVIYGETPNVFEPEASEAYTFEGWYLDKEYTERYEPAALTEDIKLYAKWTTNTYSVTYDENGAESGTAPADETAYSLNDTVTVAEAPETMVLAGYVFTTWNTQPDGGGTSYAPGETFVLTEDTTLYAQWEAVPTWELCLIKENESGEPLSGARFALYTDNSALALDAVSEDEEVQTPLTVDDITWYLADTALTAEDGTITWSGLTEERCYLLELAAPEGYTVGEQPGQVVEAAFGETQTVTVVNAKSEEPDTDTEVDDPPHTGIADMNTGLYVLVTGGALVILAGGLWMNRKKRTK